MAGDVRRLASTYIKQEIIIQSNRGDILLPGVTYTNRALPLAGSAHFVVSPFTTSPATTARGCASESPLSLRGEKTSVGCA